MVRFFNACVHNVKRVESFQNHKSNQPFFTSSIANHITLRYQGTTMGKKKNKDCFCFYSLCFHNSMVNQQWTFGLPEANMKSACLFGAYIVFCSYLITLQNKHKLSVLKTLSTSGSPHWIYSFHQNDMKFGCPILYPWGILVI